MSLAPERPITTDRSASTSTDGRIGLGRLFTSPGVDPYDEVVWERRDARITYWKDGSVAFEQLGVPVIDTDRIARSFTEPVGASNEPTFKREFHEAPRY